MDFIKEIHEARMTRNSSDQRSLTYTDCCERLYLSLLILELLRKFPGYAARSKMYAKDCSRYDSYKHFRMNGTDLYNFIYFVTGDDAAMDKLKDPGAAKALRKRTTLPLMNLNRYLTQLGNGQEASKPAEIFIKLESALYIVNTDYRSIRRYITNFKSISTINKKIAVTKLLLAARAKLRNSDLIDDLAKLSTDRDLETNLVKDNEPKVSMPDISVTGRDLAYYKYIVGTENLIMAKRFIDMARANKSIPSTAVRGYMPAITMIDDIVKAGPAYINLLRSIHNRAKNSLNK